MKIFTKKFFTACKLHVKIWENDIIRLNWVDKNWQTALRANTIKLNCFKNSFDFDSLKFYRDSRVREKWRLTYRWLAPLRIPEHKVLAVCSYFGPCAVCWRPRPRPQMGLEIGTALPEMPGRLTHPRPLQFPGKTYPHPQTRYGVVRSSEPVKKWIIWIFCLWKILLGSRNPVRIFKELTPSSFLTEFRWNDLIGTKESQIIFNQIYLNLILISWTSKHWKHKFFRNRKN